MLAFVISGRVNGDGLLFLSGFLPCNIQPPLIPPLRRGWPPVRGAIA